MESDFRQAIPSPTLLGSDTQELVVLLQKQTLNTLFQPLLDLVSCRVFGFESTVRGPVDSPLHHPNALFAAAAQADLLLELEIAACRSACINFVSQNLPASLFLNVTVASLLSRGFQTALANLVLDELALNPGRIVLEITEQHAIDDFDAVRSAATVMRKFGFSIGLDDLGAGYAGLRLWSELKPQFVKIDRHFIHNIDTDPIKRDFVRSILNISRDIACRIVAEGIETENELSAVRELGIDIGQGFLLGMPLAMPVTGVPEILTQAYAAPIRARGKMTAGDLAKPCLTVPPDTLTESVLDQFLVGGALQAIPVVDRGRPIGLALRQDLSELFSARYRRELDGRKPIRQFMRTRFICVEHDEPIEDISRRITDSADEELTQNFVVTRNDEFAGVGSTRGLLRHITELQIHNAQHCNPLTLLPGNVPINEKIDSLLATKQEFHLAYCDLNHFKPYNDVFGFARGDAVIQMTANILRRHAATGDFVGHIGGDDFVVIFQSPDWKARCAALIQAFDREIRSHFPSQALAKGGIESEDRRGKPEFFPLTSVAIGVVNPDPTRCCRHNEVAELASSAKHEAKKLGGSSLYVCKRRHL